MEAASSVAVGEEEAIVFRGVTRRFRERTAVADLNLTIAQGSVFGLLGPNGAGKTTTVRLMLGILGPSAGEIRVMGLDPVRDGARMRAQCGVVLDQVGLYERLTAEQNLAFTARLAGMGRREGETRIRESLERVELWDRRQDRVSGFSKGMRQKLGLARALITDPRILILDEPTSGLDPENIVLLRRILLALAEEQSRTIVLCTHLLDEAERLCTEVAILDGGRIRAIGAPGELQSGGQPSVRLTLRVPEGQRPEAVLGGFGAQIRVEPLGGASWRVELDEADRIEAVIACLVGAGIGVRAAIPEQESLERAYLRVVGEAEADV